MAGTTDGAVRRASAGVPVGEMDPETADTVRHRIAAFSVPFSMLCCSRVLSGNRRSPGRPENDPAGGGSREETCAEGGTCRPRKRSLCWRVARHREEDRRT